MKLTVDQVEMIVEALKISAAVHNEIKSSRRKNYELYTLADQFKKLIVPQPDIAVEVKKREYLNNSTEINSALQNRKIIVSLNKFDYNLRGLYRINLGRLEKQESNGHWLIFQNESMIWNIEHFDWFVHEETE
jgi:hypothetical protein